MEISDLYLGFLKFKINEIFKIMKKTLFFTALFLSRIICCYSQQIIPQTLVYHDSVLYFYAQKGYVIKTQLSYPKEKTFIFINDKPVDTIMEQSGMFGRNISTHDKVREDIIYFDGSFYALSLLTGKFDTIYTDLSEGEYYYIVIGDHLIGAIYEMNGVYSNFLISYDLHSKQRKVLCQIDDDWHEIAGVDATITGCLLISLVSWAEEKIVYYTYDVKTNLLEKKDYSNHVKHIYENFYSSHDDISAMYLIYGDFWLDTLFNITQPTLSRNRISTKFRGFKLKETDTYYYLGSNIDEPFSKFGSKYVWIPCRFTLSFDYCLYKIYNNQLLTKMEIEKFDEWELHKLKNMIFAKHNYKFESHYLQAFYNIFNFYFNNSKNRTTDITNLLTQEDKKNLELIQQTKSEKGVSERN
jgi:hypothetical protein